MSPTFVCNLKTNFPIQIRNLISEAVALDQIGYDIPQELLHLALQEETYESYIAHVDKVVKVYNSILQSLSAIEMNMINWHIKEMYDILKPTLKPLTKPTMQLIGLS